MNVAFILSAAQILQRSEIDVVRQYNYCGIDILEQCAVKDDDEFN